MEEIKIKEVVNYNGHSIKSNGSVDLSFIAKYDQITSSIKLLQMLNNDIKITCKLNDEKPFEIGMFRIKNVSFDDDGVSKIKFNSIDINVEMDNMARIVTNELFKISMKALIEEEEGE